MLSLNFTQTGSNSQSILDTKFINTNTVMKTNQDSTNLNLLFKFICLLFLTTYFATPLNGQVVFQSVSTGTDDYLFSTKQTPDSNYISLGYNSGLGFGALDFFLVHSDKDGNYLWSKTYGGMNSDLGYDVEFTTDGGFILVGATQSFGAGGADVLLLKVDNLGQVSWVKTFGSSNWDEGFDIEITNDGGFIIAGRTNSYGAGDGDVYIIKTTSSGEVVWTKTYGGINNEDAQQIKQTSDNGYIIVGHTNSFGAGNADIYLIKTDALGDVLWTKTYGGSNYEYGNSVETTIDGGYIITGHTNSFGAGESDMYLIKLDDLGNILWSKTYGGNNTEQSNYVIRNADGTYTITGQTNSFGGGGMDAFLIKTDASGEILWTKTYGGGMDDFSNAVCQSLNGGYAFAGNSWSLDPQSRAYIVKTDEDGDSGGCNQYTATTIIGNPAFQVGSPSATSSSGATVNNPTIQEGLVEINDSILCLTTGVEEPFESLNYNFYPNPIKQNGVLQFDYSSEHDYHLLLFDIQGNVVLNVNKISTNSIAIGKENLTSGLYFFILRSNDQIVANGKIVVE